MGRCGRWRTLSFIDVEFWGWGMGLGVEETAEGETVVFVGVALGREGIIYRAKIYTVCLIGIASIGGT